MKKTETIDICGSATLQKVTLVIYPILILVAIILTLVVVIGGLDDRFEPFKLTESTNP